jgi:hypothetical protein
MVFPLQSPPHNKILLGMDYYAHPHDRDKVRHDRMYQQNLMDKRNLQHKDQPGLAGQGHHSTIHQDK